MNFNSVELTVTFISIISARNCDYICIGTVDCNWLLRPCAFICLYFERILHTVIKRINQQSLTYFPLFILSVNRRT
jgi:hypothetical protein